MKHHDHDFYENTEKAEVRTRIVMIITGLMMVAEIFAGTVFNSMALLADGWHMSTHLVAFMIAVFAYYFARKQKNNQRFTFGTGKIGVLGGFSSSILLLVVAGVMVFESALRLINPGSIQFKEALIVAVIGLLVNLVSALILKDSHSHSHSPGDHHHNDQNLKAAYIHVLTDAFTSVTAIIALVVGLLLGVHWIDALMGFVGSLVIGIWAVGILKETSVILTDYYPKSSDLEVEIRGAFGKLEDTKIIDLHIWQINSGKFATIISLEAKNPKYLGEYHDLVKIHKELVHVSIEVNSSPFI